MRYLVEVARYWAKTDLNRPEFAEYIKTREAETVYRIEGFLHSVIVAFDGCAAGLPFGVELRTDPHPDDESDHQERGEDWYPPGVVLEGLRERYREMTAAKEPT